MKLTASLLLPLIKASTPRNCNLSGTGIFDAVGYGTDRFVYNIDYRIKTSGRLHNKGKVKQSVAELEHQHYDTSESKYTDAWVACTDQKIPTQYLIKCYNNGQFEINGVAGADAKLPDCYDFETVTTKPPRKPKMEVHFDDLASLDHSSIATPAPNVRPTKFQVFGPIKGKKPTKGKKPKKVFGCNPADLGSLGEVEYTKGDGCKKGYVTNANGVKLEKKGNSCVRQCKGSDTAIKTRYPISCFCKKSNCYYEIKIQKVGKLAWDAKDPNGQPYISTHSCVQNSAAKLPLPMATLGPETVEWNNSGVCDPLPLADSSFDWHCTNDHKAGSICTKQCTDGFMNSGDRYAHQCVCMENCVWNSHMGLFTRSFSASECVPASCKIPHGDAPTEFQDTYGWTWPPRPLKCTDTDGSEIDDGSTQTNYPVGATCTKECPQYYKHPLDSMGIDGAVTSTCKCSKDHNGKTSCNFDPINLFTCLPAVCSTNAQELYAFGLEEEAKAIWFRAPYRLNCEKVVPDGHMHAGKAEYGSSCEVSCAPGWKMEDRSMTSFKLYCGIQMYKFGWTKLGPYPRCVQACEDPLPPKNLKEATIPLDGIIWSCNDSNYVGSVCQKACAEGYVMKGSKTINACQCKGPHCDGGPMWRGATSNCAKELKRDNDGKIMRNDKETYHEEVRESLDAFIGDIFG